MSSAAAAAVSTIEASSQPSVSTPRLAPVATPNSPAEQDLVSVLLAPQLGVDARQVPGWGSLLVGPVLRGAEVSYR